jgi:hypothetical protein
MLIHLRHPVHGKKIATMDLEAEADEQNGWKRYDPDAPATVSIDTQVNALETKRRRRQVDVIAEEDK